MDTATGLIEAWIAWEAARIAGKLHGSSERDRFESWIDEMADECGLSEKLADLYQRN